MHHICGVHSWVDQDSGVDGCSHGPLVDPQTKPCLHPKADSQILKHLAVVVFDQLLLKNVEKVITYRCVAVVVYVIH
jgi:hypothetical protein